MELVFVIPFFKYYCQYKNMHTHTNTEPTHTPVETFVFNVRKEKHGSPKENNGNSIRILNGILMNILRIWFFYSSVLGDSRLAPFDLEPRKKKKEEMAAFFCPYIIALNIFFQYTQCQIQLWLAFYWKKTQHEFLFNWND